VATNRFTVISRQKTAINLQSSDSSAYARLVNVLNHLASEGCVTLDESPDFYFHRCCASGMEEHVGRAWQVIVDQLIADGWVRLDRPSAANPDADNLMYFGVPRQESAVSSWASRLEAYQLQPVF
jgi:hypothetical protein